MTSPTARSFAAIFLSLLAVALRAAEPLEFVGFVQSETQPRFMLRDVRSGAISGWLASGQSFRGYRIGAYDPKAETLTVAGEAGRLSLRLIDAKVGRGLAIAPEDGDMDTNKRVTVTGAVKKRGSVKPLPATTTVADAVAAMGGFASDADITKVRLMRRATRTINGETKPVLNLRILDCTKPEGTGFKLEPGDTVSVPKTGQ